MFLHLQMDDKMAMSTLPYLTLCEDNAPETLLELCLKYVVDHLDTICSIDPITKAYKLKNGLTLPVEICEKIVHGYQRGGNILDDRFLNIFQNPQTRLQRVHLRNSTITDDGLCALLNQKLQELVIDDCFNITESSLEHINNSGDSLLSLVIEPSVDVLPTAPHGTAYDRRGYILRTPNLRRLAVRQFIACAENPFPLLLLPLHNLTHLDLSECYDLRDLSYLCELKSLVSLILYNVKWLESAMGSLCKLVNLR
jgi:Zyg-11 family protein